MAGELIYKSTGANKARLEGIIRYLLGDLPKPKEEVYPLGDTPEDQKVKAVLRALPTTVGVAA